MQTCKHCHVNSMSVAAQPDFALSVMQLLNWYKRRHNPVEGCRLYRVAPQCSAAPTYLVLKVVQQPQLSCLDPRGAFLIHCPSNMYLWQVRFQYKH